jgi:hypothetical protein
MYSALATCKAGLDHSHSLYDPTTQIVLSLFLFWPTLPRVIVLVFQDSCTQSHIDPQSAALISFAE